MTRRINEDAVRNELAKSPFFNSQQPPAQKSAQNVEQHPAQKVAQKSAQLSNVNFTSDDVEGLDFSLRKLPKAKFNTNIPVEWKDEVEKMAFDLKVGRYELGLYLVAKALGKVK